MDQIQIRIDLKTKKQVKKILEELGLDISTAVKMLFKQIIHTGTLPFSPIQGKQWKKIIDFTKIKKHGVNIKEVLSKL
ncbi:MAG: hypothetical protein C0412_15705 [Flavobacterium sp.]|nr:hypothetical protein [Flavobacterium sp.]